MSTLACFGKVGERNIRQPLLDCEFMATIQSTIIGQHRCNKDLLTRVRYFRQKYVHTAYRL